MDLKQRKQLYFGKLIKMKDDSPIQNGDYGILADALKECAWIGVLSSMSWNEKLYWKMRGMKAYYKNR